jgi:polysaccharide export outer membrane protein
MAETPGQEEVGAAAQTATSAGNGQDEHGNAYEEYRIGPYDLLEISIFQVTEMSRAVRVNAKGVITLPLIGQVQAGGLTALQLEDAIAGRLSQDLLQDPQVSVFIKEFVSQRVTVEGAVVKAGVYPLSGKTTLIQAIAMASGLDPLADENQVKIFRGRSDGRKELGIHDLEAIRSGKAADPVIMGNDVIIVEKSGSKATIKGITDTLRGFFSFGTMR